MEHPISFYVVIVQGALLLVQITLLIISLRRADLASDLLLPVNTLMLIILGLSFIR